MRWIGLRGDLESPISSDSMAIPTGDALLDLFDSHGSATQTINDVRETAGFEPLDDHVVVVETFFMHHPLGRGLLPDPWIMYAQTEVRVVSDRSS